MESNGGVSQNDNDQVQNDGARTRTLNSDKKFECLTLHDGKIEFPNWASDTPFILWVMVCAISDTLSRGSSSATIRRESIVDGMITIALKLEFGASHNQISERTLAVHFTYPFFVKTHVTDKCNDGTLLMQVILHSEVKAKLTIYAWLDFQDGFVHTDGRPNSSFFPLIISPTSKAGILFSICLNKTNAEGARIVISVLCMPLVAGYVRPPLLGFPDVDEVNISCKPAGPHLFVFCHHLSAPPSAYQSIHDVTTIFTQA